MEIAEDQQHSMNSKQGLQAILFFDLLSFIFSSGSKNRLYNNPSRPPVYRQQQQQQQQQQPVNHLPTYRE